MQHFVPFLSLAFLLVTSIMHTPNQCRLQRETNLFDSHLRCSILSIHCFLKARTADLFMLSFKFCFADVLYFLQELLCFAVVFTFSSTAGKSVCNKLHAINQLYFWQSCNYPIACNQYTDVNPRPHILSSRMTQQLSYCNRPTQLPHQIRLLLCKLQRAAEERGFHFLCSR